MSTKGKKTAATLSLTRCALYTRQSTDPLSVWNHSQRILFALSHKVRRAIRLKLDGHGRAEAETDELVNDAFLAVIEALPRFQPAKAQFTTFVYGLARRRMRLVVRACFYGLSPEQMHRLDTAKRTPSYHRNNGCLRSTQAPPADPEQRLSVRRVAGIRQRLPRADRHLLDLYLQEGGNYAAVARRLGDVPESVRRRYTGLFSRIRAAV